MTELLIAGPSVAVLVALAVLAGVRGVQAGRRAAGRRRRPHGKRTAWWPGACGEPTKCGRRRAS